jgi:hypothetical protein
MARRGVRQCAKGSRGLFLMKSCAHPQRKEPLSNSLLVEGATIAILCFNVIGHAWPSTSFYYLFYASLYRDCFTRVKINIQHGTQFPVVNG